MELKDKINNDLKIALLGGDRFKAEVIRGIKAVILNEEVASGKRDEGLKDEIIEQLLAKEVKKRNESATIYDNANRLELADNERAEAKVINTYLPTQLSEDEISEEISKTIDEMDVSDPSAMGQVIGAVKKKLGNTAEGALIAKIVKNKLN